MPSQNRSFLFLPFLFSSCGVLFSLWNLWGEAELLCVTEGCALFRDFELAGISLWWLGVAGFAILMLAAIPGFAVLSMVLAACGVLLDCLLLVVMLLTAPCVSCLLIGLLLALTYAACRAATNGSVQTKKPRSVLSPLLLLWSLLFILNIGCAVHDSADLRVLTVTTRDQGGDVQANAQSGENVADAAQDNVHDVAVRVYFSPSCPACLTLVQSLSDPSRLPEGGVVWYAVAENSTDVPIIAAMQTALAKGRDLASAVEEATKAPASRLDLLRPSGLLLQFGLWRNKAHVLASGSPRLPFVEFRGLPTALLPSARAEKRASSVTEAMQDLPSGMDTHAPYHADLPFLDVAGFCDDAQPCPDAALSGPISLPKP